ncbi:MAG: GMC family oxidoreductase N-terminal domain-containing protein [Alphaproteobacteria bacterium]
MLDFDYIIIGAGSAGCVLADKLSESGKYSVLVLESGPSDRRFWVRVPIGYGISYHDKRVNWKFECEPIPGLNDRRMYYPRGKVLGGSSSINALVYHRGLARDYDDWAAAGNPGWDYQSVEPVFNSFEYRAKVGEEEAPRAGETRLSVTDATKSNHPLQAKFVEMCQQMQMPTSASPSLEGHCVAPYYITTRAGMRCSSAVAFLHPARNRTNLHVLTGISVRRIGIENRRATHVECLQNGESQTFRARREILLTAGAVNSPQLLQLSGVGPQDVIRGAGLPVVLDQPNVGSHMEDHLGVNYIYKANRPTLNDVLGRWPGRILAGAEYLLRRTGPLSLSVNQFGGLVKSAPHLAEPDTQLYINPLSYQSFYKGRRALTKPDKFSGFILSFNSCRPASRGKVSIRSGNPDDAPMIMPNYLSAQQDIDDVIRMARLIQRMQHTPAIQGLLAGPPLTSLDSMSDDEIVEDFRNRCGTVFHPCCTCRMGPDPQTSVVDGRLRVHGIDALRVCDASVFPNITSANTNAPTIMVAHKAAQMILEDAKAGV